MWAVRLYLQPYMKIKHIFTFFISCLIAFACDDPDCIYQGGVRIKIGFYSDQNGKVQSVRINSLSIANSDSVLIKTQTEVTSVILPLNPATESITAYFDTEFGYDTLTIGYNRFTSLISEDCGVETRYGGLNIIRSDFDSVKVSRGSTDINFLDPSTVNENIKVYN